MCVSIHEYITGRGREIKRIGVELWWETKNKSLTEVMVDLIHINVGIFHSKKKKNEKVYVNVYSIAKWSRNNKF